MSRRTRNIRQKQIIQHLVQNLIEKHNLGNILADKALGKTKYLVLEKLDYIGLLGRTATHLIDIKYNSENGVFTERLALIQFATTDEVKSFVEVTNWIKFRVGDNHKVMVPNFDIIDDINVLYRIDGLNFDMSPVEHQVKLKLSGEALAAFHANTINKINDFRYLTLLNTKIGSLLLGKSSKDKLMSFGFTFFAYYFKLKSGIYSYGDFNPGNIIISRNGAYTTLIPPGRLESSSENDRFEDIANFFVFDTIHEYLETKSLNQTIINIRVFLDSYKSALKSKSNILMEDLYNNTQWISLFFHLGLSVLVKGAEIIRSISYNNDPTEQNLEETVQTYKISKFIWKLGIDFLPDTIFPPGLSKANLSSNNSLITWAYLVEILITALKNDLYFKLVFDFPESSLSVSLEESLTYWKISDKKELVGLINKLNSWLFSSIIIIKKKDITRNDNWINILGLPSNFSQNWELSSKLLLNLFLKNPSNKIIQYLDSNNNVHQKKLQDINIKGKELKFNLKRLEKMNIIQIQKSIIHLKSNWKNNLKLPEHFEFSYLL